MTLLKSETRHGTTIKLIAVHTNEGDNPANVYPDRTAENLAAYLDRENTAGRSKSYHSIVDDDSELIYVDPEQAAWALPYGGNLPGLQLCFTGWARWSRAEWLTHRAMLERGALVVRRWAQQYNIPLRHLTPQQVKAGERGIIGHADWTNSAPGKRGTHTDPGDNFPWDVLLAYSDPPSTPASPAESRKARHNTMDPLPPTPVPADPHSPSKTWPQRNHSIYFDPAGGWEGDCAMTFGVQDWASGRSDEIRGHLLLASWITADRKLVPVDSVFTTAQGGRTVSRFNPLAAFKAPTGAVGVTLNYAAPGGAGIATGRSS